MSADDYTRPERASEFNLARRRWEKRYKAVVNRKGLCSVCTHRSLTETPFGRSICRVGEMRQHPQCERDGKGIGFEVDSAEVDKMKDAA